jgi:hypothetical protein
VPVTAQSLMRGLRWPMSQSAVRVGTAGPGAAARSEPWGCLAGIVGGFVAWSVGAAATGGAVNEIKATGQIKPVPAAEISVGWLAHGAPHSATAAQYFEPFEVMHAGEWRTFRVRDYVTSVIGLSTDGRAAMFVEYEQCGANCTYAPVLHLLFRNAAPQPCPQQDCRAPVTVQVDEGLAWRATASVYLGVLAAADSGVIDVAPESESYAVPDYRAACYTFQRKCWDGSFMPTFRRGRRIIRVGAAQANGRVQTFDFDIATQPFRALDDLSKR